MKQILGLSFILLFSMFSYKAFAFGNHVCKHGGVIYAYANNGSCSNYVGGNVHLNSGWIHIHGGNNQFSISENISDNSDPNNPIGTILSENTDHCTITKVISNQDLN